MLSEVSPKPSEVPPCHPQETLWATQGSGSRCALLHGKLTPQQSPCKLLSKINLGRLDTYCLRVGEHYVPPKHPRAGSGG